MYKLVGVLLFLYLCCIVDSADEVLYLPGYGALDTPSYAGYTTVNSELQSNIFWWFIQSEQAATNVGDIPLVLWINGGPGASSLTGEFSENGPYLLNFTDNTVYKNPYAWTKYYHMIFLDNPVGTGYSYTNPLGYVRNLDQMAKEFVLALRGFFSRHPEFLQSDLYLSGESYAGKYLPHIAAEIVKQNKAGLQVMNLKGMALGNGFISPMTQENALPKWYETLGLIDESQRTISEQGLARTQKLIDSKMWAAATYSANSWLAELIHFAGDFFQYDVRKLSPNTLDDLENGLIKYLNQPEVKVAFHVDTFRNWSESDGTGPVAYALYTDLMKNNTVELFPQLLTKDDLRVMIYVGNMDGSDCGLAPQNAFLDELHWEGREEFFQAPRYTWYTNDGFVGGYVRETADKQFTYNIIHNAGHLVPMDQPLASLMMMYNFIEKKPWNSTLSFTS